MRDQFDSEAFYAALDAHRLAKQLTWKQVAEETGIAASTLSHHLEKLKNEDLVKVRRDSTRREEGDAALAGLAGDDSAQVLWEADYRQSLVRRALEIMQSELLKLTDPVSPRDGGLGGCSMLDAIVSTAF